MISAEKWWGIIDLYGTQIWPIQILFYFVAILLIGWFIIKPEKLQNWIIKLYFSIAFAWNGIMFFLIFAKNITGDSYGHYFFGSLFLIVSIMFLFDLFRNKMHFSLPEARWNKNFTLILLLLVFCYPLFSITFKRSITSLIIPGTFPCPTVALGLLLLTTALPRVNKISYILLLLWAIPFPPFIQIPKYGVYEDTIMFVCGLYSLYLLLRYWKDRDSRLVKRQYNM